MNSDKKTMVTSEAVFGAVTLVAGLLLFLHSFNPKYAGMGIGAEFGPVFYPRILLVLWILLALQITAKAVLKPWDQTLSQKWLKVFSVIAILSASTLLMDILGFLFSSILFCVAYSWVAGYRKPGGLLLVGFVFPVVTWYLFHNILMIRLPTSLWFEWV